MEAMCVVLVFYVLICTTGTMFALAGLAGMWLAIEGPDAWARLKWWWFKSAHREQYEKWLEAEIERQINARKTAKALWPGINLHEPVQN